MTDSDPESTEVEIGGTTYTVEKEEVREAFEETDPPESASHKIVIDGEKKGSKDVFRNIDGTPDNFYTRHSDGAFKGLGFDVIVEGESEDSPEPESADRGIYLVKVGGDWMDNFERTVKNSLHRDDLKGSTPSGFEDLEGKRVWRTTGNSDTFEAMKNGDYLLFHHDDEFFAFGRVGQKHTSPELGEYIWDNEESKYIYTVKDLQDISLPEQELWSILGWEDMESLRENLKSVDDGSRESLLEEYSTVDELIKEYEENSDEESERSWDNGELWVDFSGATREIVEDMVTPPGTVDATVARTLEDYDTIAGLKNEEQYNAFVDALEAVALHPDFTMRSEESRQRVKEEIKERRGEIYEKEDDSEEKGDNSGTDYYWVNQTRETEIENGFLRAPVDNTHHHDLSVLREGDVVFHYVDQRIIGHSEVTSEVRIEKQDGDEYYFVDVDLHEYDEKPGIDEINRYLLREDVRLDKYYPLDSSGGVNQGYLFRLSEDGANWLREPPRGQAPRLPVG